MFRKKFAEKKYTHNWTKHQCCRDLSAAHAACSWFESAPKSTLRSEVCYVFRCFSSSLQMFPSFYVTVFSSIQKSLRSASLPGTGQSDWADWLLETLENEIRTKTEEEIRNRKTSMMPIMKQMEVLAGKTDQRCSRMFVCQFLRKQIWFPKDDDYRLKGWWFCYHLLFMLL